MLQHAGEFQGDVSRALHDNPLRLSGELKEVIGVNAELMTGDTGVCDRSRSCGNKKRLCGNFLLLVNNNCVGVDQACMAFVNLYARLLKVTPIDLFEPVDLLVTIFNQDLPIKLRCIHTPAIAACLIKLNGEPACIDHKLLGNAASNDAGSTKSVFFNQCNSGTVACSNTGCAYTARATSNYNQVVGQSYFLSKQFGPKPI